MQISQKSDKWYAMAITLAFHGLLLLLFLLYKIITPIPPFEIIEPGGGGGLGAESGAGGGGMYPAGIRSARSVSLTCCCF